MNQNTKEMLWSGSITFVTAFLIAILPMLGGLEPTQAAFLGLITAGIRAGVKAVAGLLTGRNLI